MLSKLLKHEFRAMGRILLPLYAVTLIMSLVSGLSANIMPIGYTDWSDKFPAVGAISQITGALMIVIFFLLVFVAMILCVVFSISRYKNNLHGHQGYLMHTLPVTAFENVFTKVIVAAAYQLLAMFTVFFAMLFFSAMAGEVNILEIAREIISFFTSLSARTGFTVFLVLVTWVFGIISFNTTVCAAISIGHSFNGAKVLKSIGFFILMSVAETYLYYGITRIASAFDWNISIYSIDAAVNAVNAALAVNILRSFLKIAFFTWLSSHFIKNRLNLE